MNITTDQLRQIWLKFWQSKQHSIIKSAGVIPENDPTALFYNSGMHPLVPYLMGEKHPSGVRLTNSQKCIRTGDIDEVGDATHLTFFEMLGNWSLGDFFKEQQIPWAFEFLVKELNIPLEKLAFSVFKGDDNAPRDEFSAETWLKQGVSQEKIAFLPASENWWNKGETGPCGPDSEIFFWTGEGQAPQSFQDSWEDPRWVEIWNNVFMQFNKKEDGTLEDLPSQNIDTGMGLERTVAILNGKKSVYETDAFADILEIITKLSSQLNDDFIKNPLQISEQANSARIIADHIRSSVVILADNIPPSNVDQGYILRRLIRRTVRHGRKLQIGKNFTTQIAKVAIQKLGNAYPELLQNEKFIINELQKEEINFEQTLEKGEKEFQKIAQKNSQEISGEIAFNLFQTYGFPLEMTIELAQEKNLKVNEKDFHQAFEDHQNKSRAGAEKKFQGGLSRENIVEETKLHTANHLLLAGLQEVLGENIHQAGSNITAERLRFDFNYEEKVSRENLDKIEQFVNDAIQAQAEMVLTEMNKNDAKAQGVEGSFWEKYPDIVKVFSFTDKQGKTWSKELCGGPHVANTKELGTFKIKKEQASSRGIRRIKAILIS
jgi:alanyl-tRNA synthetase